MLLNESKLHKMLVFSALVGIAFFYSSQVFANPQEGQVISGNADISSSSQHMTITQQSDKAIIHWKDFSIGKGEITEFIQPSSQSSVLNQVTGFNPSMIEGMLKANGQVLLVNPQGVIVTKEGSISTKGFLATTLLINTEDFLSGNNLLLRGDSDAKIQNLGTIESEEGDVFLIAREVENKGTILAKDTAALVGGNEVLLVQEGQKAHVKMPTSGTVCNEGLIKAAQVELKAAGGNIFSYAVSHTGVIEARGFENREGRIFLKGESNKTIIDGKLSALNANETGGTIHILGEDIRLLEKTHIDISGRFGAGTLLTGGDYQGANPEIPNGKYLFVHPEAQVFANALEKGDGGKVIFWGDEGIAFAGQVEAMGNGKEHEGGFVEVSSHGHWSYKGKVDARSLNEGKTGTLLFDPESISIQNNATVNVTLNSTGDPYIFTPNASGAILDVNDVNNFLLIANLRVQTGAGLGNGDIFVQTPIASTSGNYLQLVAYRRVIVSSPINITGNLIITCEDFQTTAAITTSKNITINVTTSSQANYPRGITLFAGGNISTTGTGNITLNGTHGLEVVPASNNSGVEIKAGASVSVVNGSISITGINNNGSGATTGNNGVTIAGTVQATGSDHSKVIQINGTGGLGGSSSGIYCTGASSIISSATNNITLTGSLNGSGTNTNLRAIYLLLGPQIISTGSSALTAATITLNGTVTGSSSGTTQIGVMVDTATIITDIGAVSITGSNTSAATSSGGFGIYFYVADVNATSGAITLNGTGAGVTGCRGTMLQGSTHQLTSTGNISVTGLVNAVNATGDNQIGVYIVDSFAVAATGGGLITIDGQVTSNGIGGQDNNFGVNVSSSGSVSSVDGDISITGKCFATGTGNYSVYNASSIRATGTGNLTIVADGNAIGANSVGFYNAGVFDCVSGDILVTAQAGGLTQNAITLVSPVGQATMSGDITLIGNTMDLSQTIALSVVKTTGDVYLQPYNTAASIGVGTGAAGTLSFDNTELANIQTTAASVRFGTLITGSHVITIQNPGNALTMPQNLYFYGQNVVLSSPMVLTAPNVYFYVGQGSAATFDLSGTVIVSIVSGAFNIYGGSGNDSFTISNTAQDVDLLNGGGGTNTLIGSLAGESWDLTVANQGTLTQSGVITFTNIQNLTGVITNTDIVNGPNTATAWTASGANAGSVLSMNFTRMGTLNGGASTDTLTDALGGATWTLTSPNAGSLLSMAFTSMDNLIGFGTDTLSIASGPTSWSITGSNSGSVLSTPFSGMANLTGGSAKDTFTFAASGSISGTVAGSGSILNEIVGPAGTIGWSATAANSGTIDTTATGGGSTTFSNIYTLTGNGTDTLTDALGGATWTLTSANAGSLLSMNFTSMDNLIGFGTDTLSIASGPTSWSITGSNSGSVLSTPFSGMANLTGGSAKDTFTFAATGSISGSVNGTSLSLNEIVGPSGTIGWTATAANSGTIDTTATGGGSTIFSNIYTLTGNGTDTLTAPSGPTTWSITGSDAGSVLSMSFTHMENLTGGSAKDTFSFAATGSISGTVNGTSLSSNEIVGPAGTIGWTATAANSGTIDTTATGGGSTIFTNIYTLTGNGTDTLTDTLGGATWTLTGPNAGSLLSMAFTGMDNLIGFGTDTLSIASGPTSWSITGSNSGSVLSTPFSGMANLTGGSAKDTFSFAATGSISGTVSGGGSILNEIVGPAGTIGWTATAANSGTIDTTATGGGSTIFSNIYTLTGNGTDTLTAPSGPTTWSITDSDAGSVLSMSFTHMENLSGGTGQDTFTFGTLGRISGTLTGGGSSLNTIIGPDATNTWTITGSNSGNMDPVTASGATSFVNIQNVTGAASNDDIFILTTAGSVLTGTTGINGNGGASNLLSSPNIPANFAVNSNNQGVITPLGGTGTKYQNVQKLNGSGTADDILDYSGNLAPSLTVDFLNFSATDVNVLVPGTVGPINSFSNIRGVEIGSTATTVNLTGNPAFFSTLGINAGDNKWTITGTNTGYVETPPISPTRTINFSNFFNLRGGTGDDEFVFLDGQGVTGYIDGGTPGGQNELNYTNYSTPVIIDLVNGTATNVGGGISNFMNVSIGQGTLIGGSADDVFYVKVGGASIVDGGPGINTLIGPLHSNVWHIDGSQSVPASGYINNVIDVDFDKIQRLVGGGFPDTFILSEIGAVDFIDGASDNDTLQAKDQDNTWNITDNNAGNVSGVGSFISIENLLGGSLADRFVLADQKGVSGIIDGGSDSGNILDYSQYTTLIFIDFENKTATNIGGFDRIQGVIYPPIESEHENGILITQMMTGLNYDQYEHLGNYTKMLHMRERPLIPFEGYYWNKENDLMDNEKLLKEMWE